MLSKNQTKLIRCLKQKKYRTQHGLFVVEGVKAITELLHSNFKLHHIYTRETFNIDAKKEIIISEADLKRISFLTTPNQALAVFIIPEPAIIDANQLIIALNDIRDPGNLGTIIRLCDWFGVKDLVCSHGTVDCYNPKVVQATMGSISRVNITYVNLADFLNQTGTIKWGAFMEGENIYNMTLPNSGVLVLGNEANGIDPVIESFIDKKITIPRFKNIQAPESLNVATATAIFLSEFKRRATER